MVRSGMTLPSFLCIFSVLLMLSPELLLGAPDVYTTNPEMQRALTFALEQYNRDMVGDTNYFKQLRLLKLQRDVMIMRSYHLMMELVETTCEKRPGVITTYKNVQKCQERPGIPLKRICFFKVPVIYDKHLRSKMDLTDTTCF